MPDTARQPGDIVALAVVLALATVAAWRSVGYGLWSYGEPAPGLFPLLASGVTAIFAVLALVGCLAGSAPSDEFDPEAAQQDGPMLWGKLALYAAVVLVWPWLMVPLGFVLSTARPLRHPAPGRGHGLDRGGGGARGRGRP